MEKGAANDSTMLLVANRMATFKNWPFNEEEGSTCMHPSQVGPFHRLDRNRLTRMAEAGFYACGGNNDPDLARCYYCRWLDLSLTHRRPRKELDGWEPEDEHMAEHVKHARGNCAFVNMGKKSSELTVSDVSSGDLCCV
jgi:baculoviral IAP repeat-containing protein 5